MATPFTASTGSASITATEESLVNASTTGENGCYVFERIVEEARRASIPCSGILLVDPEQMHWRDKLAGQPHISVLMQPVKYKQLVGAIKDLL